MTLSAHCVQSGGAILIGVSGFNGGTQLACDEEKPLPNFVAFNACAFSSNAAKSEGGAIAVYSGDVTVQVNHALLTFLAHQRNLIPDRRPPFSISTFKFCTSALISRLPHSRR